MKQKKILLLLALMLTAVARGAELSEVGLSVKGEEHVFTTVALVVIIICVSVLILAYIIKQALAVWRDGEIAYHANESSRQKSDELLGKYLDLLEKKNEQGVYDGDQYRETLALLVDLSQKGKLSDITEEALNAIFKVADESKPAK